MKSFFWICAMFGGVLSCLSAAPVADRPNVLFILADDFGWGDLRCYGNPVVDTPALDALAASGVRFTDHYSPSSLCAPARASYLTGRYNHRTGAVDVPSNRGLDRLAPGEKTFGDYFRHAGYATALIGKWHNGVYSRDQLPHRRGFDLFYGFANGGHDYWKWHLQRNDAVESHDGRYMTDAFNDEAIAFMKRSVGRPFAIFLAHHTPHSPLQAPEPLVRKYRARLGADATEAVVLTYAMIEAMDAGLGRVFQALKDAGQWERTVIVFTSDNGPVLRRDPEFGLQKRFNGAFSGEKESMLEGGVRVPGIVAWPGRIRAGQVVSVPVHGCDWLPTLYGLTGRTPPPGAKSLDGANLLPLLEGRDSGALAERPLFFQRNRYAPAGYTNAAVRAGRWKLYWAGDESAMRKDAGRDNPSYRRGVVHPHWEMPLDRQLDAAKETPARSPRLYDLEKDPAEKNDVAAAHPDIVRTLTAKHTAWYREVSAEWREARSQIVAQDIAYWKKRSAPEPAALLRDFWQWQAAPKGTDPKTADPLKVFRGYWNDE
jgi:arylsulfatase A-like enzyme